MVLLLVSLSILNVHREKVMYLIYQKRKIHVHTTMVVKIPI